MAFTAHTSWLIGQNMTASSIRKWMRTKVAFADYLSSSDRMAATPSAIETDSKQRSFFIERN